MGTEGQVLLWWVLFGGAHVVGSSRVVRPFLIGKLGLGPFKGLYSLVAFATFIPLCWVYFTDKHAGTLLFDPPAALQWVTIALMVVAFVVLVQGQTTPSPLTTTAEMSGRYPAEPRGIQRITRHPSNTAFALFGLAHMLVNPFSADWIFFGGFVAYGVMSSLHQDARMRATANEKIRGFLDQTSLVPFAAILGGRQRLKLGELQLGPLVISLVIAALLWRFHGVLFGGFGY